MSAKGVSEVTIINTVRSSRTIYNLTTINVNELQEAGVSPAITDYSLATPSLYGGQRGLE